MKRRIVVVVVGILVGSATALAAVGDEEAPPFLIRIDGVDVEFGCEEEVVTHDFLVSAPSPEEKGPGFTASEIGSKVWNPMNRDRGVPVTLEEVSDRAYRLTDNEGKTTFVAEATPFAGDEFMFTHFVYCAEGPSPGDLFPQRLNPMDGEFLDEHGNITDG